MERETLLRMLFTISTTHKPATDLGYLLHKSPYRAQSFDLPFGRAHVFYPEASDELCTAAMLLDIDPVALVRRKRGDDSPGTLSQYVNDRPYVASSFLSVALSRVFGSALGGRSKDASHLVDVELPIEVCISVLPCRGGEGFLRRLFEPLGYAITAAQCPLDEKFPEWGDVPLYTVRLRKQARLADVLTHIYVLVPVLDNEKHYWVGEDELEKLLRRGEGWLASHPEKEAIAVRYLKYRRSLANEALERLVGDVDPDPDTTEEVHGNEEDAIERPLSLNEQRIGAVIGALRESGAKRVIDLGCGEGRLIRSMLEVKQFEEIVGMDVSHRSLERAESVLRFDRMPTKVRERITLMQGSLTYRDKRLAGFDAAAVVEVIEHLDEGRLAAFERVLFEFARPESVIVTTPNVEYNVRFDGLPAGKFRHKDHRFEWTREQFRSWAESVADRNSYSVRFTPVGPEDPEVGPPTQMAIFVSKAPFQAEGQ